MEKTKPDIYRAIKMDTILENVTLETEGDKLIPNYFDTSKTENGRVSYPIFHIPNYVSCQSCWMDGCVMKQISQSPPPLFSLQHKLQVMGHPNHIIFLSCDAFGILPPVAKLTLGQAMYHF